MGGQGLQVSHGPVHSAGESRASLCLPAHLGVACLCRRNGWKFALSGCQALQVSEPWVQEATRAQISWQHMREASQKS
jgi:hypothetical protein